MLFLALNKVRMVKITSPQVPTTIQIKSPPPAKFPIPLHCGGIPPVQPYLKNPNQTHAGGALSHGSSAMHAT